MKIVYMGDAQRIDRVYGPVQRARLTLLSGEEPENVSCIGPGLEDVEWIFSTWGMLTPSEEEIRKYLPGLKAVFYAAGSVQYFARPFLDAGVRVFSAWQANAVPVAQFAFAEIILALKGTFRVMEEARTSREKAKETVSHYPGAYEVKIGILGCGAVGALLCGMLSDAGFEVWVYDPYVPDEKLSSLGVKRAEMGSIFSECDVVSNHLPDLPSTKGLIRREHLMSMKPYSAFINTGRGPQLDETDLFDSLRADDTRTAILDVMTDEGRSDEKPLTRLPNCFITPHIAGSLGNEVRRMADCMLDAYCMVRAGEKYPSEVTAGMLDTMA